MAGLRRFVGPAPPRPAGRAPGESCSLCGVPIPEEHPHVVHVEARGLRCACRPCYLLFVQQNSGGGHYRAVPERYHHAPGADLSEGQWDALGVPVGMAFFFVNSALGRVVAQYPSPAGATESLLDLAAWDEVVAANPLAAALEPDVEALFVHRSRDGNATYLVPIDVCYELVGRMRLHWSGFDGGAEVRTDVADFLRRLQERSRPLAAVVAR